MPAEREVPYDSLGALVASDEFRGLAVRPDGHGGGYFTIKAVLEVRDAPLGVYLYGHVDSVEMLPSVLDDVLRKGAWRVDKYWKP